MNEQQTPTLEDAVKETQDLLHRREQLEMDLQDVNSRLAVRLGVPGVNGRVVSTGDVPQQPKNGHNTVRGPNLGNEKPLAEVLLSIVKKDQPMSVDDLSRAALESGYKSKSKNHTKVVRELLYKDKRFKKKSMGNRRVGFVAAH